MSEQEHVTPAPSPGSFGFPPWRGAACWILPAAPAATPGISPERVPVTAIDRDVSRLGAIATLPDVDVIEADLETGDTV